MMAQVQYQTLSDSQLLADMAVEALIDEVNLTPKPALVDRRGSGAHDDLTLELMERSAKSLGPMFDAMAQAAKHHGKVCLALREDIGEIGRQGEKTMMLATNGVNTHRGAIWALGLMVTAAALARTNQQYFSAVELCHAYAAPRHGLYHLVGHRCGRGIFAGHLDLGRAGHLDAYFSRRFDYGWTAIDEIIRALLICNLVQAIKQMRSFNA